MTSSYVSAAASYFTPSGDSTIDPFLNTSYLKWGGALGSGATLSFSFPWINGNTANWQENYTTEITATEHFGLNSIQMVAAREALQSWENVADLKFSELSETSSSVGDFRFAFSSAVEEASSTTWGWSRFPNNYWANSADVWINTGFASDTTWSAGDYNYESLIHEIGHGLGLKHPGDYDVAGNGDEPFISADLDSKRYSVMSYIAPTDNIYPSAEYVDKKWVWKTYFINPETPMVLDIAAIQYLYGENRDYNSGDTTYTFDPKSPFFKTIWDGAGTDTISVANFTISCKVDLTAGSYSSIRYAKSTNSGGAKTTYDGVDNLGIAYNCTIENAVGGRSSDMLIGNSANNCIDGGLGKDTMAGGMGDDTYIVDNKTDVVTESANAGTDTIKTSLASYSIALLGNIENLTYIGIKSSVLTGNAGNNFLTGGTGRDTIVGGNGNDTICGGIGNDELIGGVGADYFRFDTSIGNDNNDQIIDLVLGTDKIELENAIFIELVTTGMLTTGFLSKTGIAVDANDYVIYNTTTGALSYDADGSGKVSAAVVFATITTGLTTLSEADFIVT